MEMDCGRHFQLALWCCWSGMHNFNIVVALLALDSVASSDTVAAEWGWATAEFKAKHMAGAQRTKASEKQQSFGIQQQQAIFGASDWLLQWTISLCKTNNNNPVPTTIVETMVAPWQLHQHTKWRLHQAFWLRSIRSNEPVAMMVVETVVAFAPTQQAVITTAPSKKSVVGEATGATTQPEAT